MPVSTGVRALPPGEKESGWLCFGLCRLWSGASNTRCEHRCDDDARSGDTYHGVMFERFTDDARHVLVRAQEEARNLNHGFIGTEHLLLGLLGERDGLVVKALASMGVTEQAVRAGVKEIVGPLGDSGRASQKITPRSKLVLELSLREALQLGQNHVGPGHILLGILSEGEGNGVQVLLSLGADLSQLRQHVRQLLAIKEPLPPATIPADDLYLKGTFGTIAADQRRGFPWWRPLLARRWRRWGRQHPLPGNPGSGETGSSTGRTG